MKKTRSIKSILPTQKVMEGAGVKLNRAFSNPQIPLFDPFLLLDHFKSDQLEDYIKGFPWHPHRGIETVTYMLKGEIEHGDSLGNKGIIKPGDVQWMTAGSGIIHQEMPQKSEGIDGFQLWVNLAAKNKMTDPVYREITRDEIPDVKLDSGVIIKIISGFFNDVAGPVTGLDTDPCYLDVSIPSRTSFTYEIHPDYTLFIYLYNSKLLINDDQLVEANSTVLFNKGDKVTFTCQDVHSNFLLVSGKPIHEHVEWAGPIVMNTPQEIQQAFKEYQEGTFIKSH